MKACAQPDFVRACAPPDWAGGEAKRGARRQGVLYEWRVQGHLQELWGELYFPSPWFFFTERGRPRWCQPDGLHFDLRAGTCTIVEIKYRHCPEAWQQLSLLYRPVLRKLMPRWKFPLLEVVKWHDPAVKMPCAVHLRDEPRGDLKGLGVYSWQK